MMIFLSHSNYALELFRRTLKAPRVCPSKFDEMHDSWWGLMRSSFMVLYEKLLYDRSFIATDRSSMKISIFFNGLFFRAPSRRFAGLAWFDFNHRNLFSGTFSKFIAQMRAELRRDSNERQSGKDSNELRRWIYRWIPHTKSSSL